MREHLYKAKRVNWRELPKEEWWVDGNLLISDDDYYIIPDFGVSCVEKLNNFVCDKLITLHAFEVDKETVCEYTGLQDKNGRKIFENDIVETVYDGNVNPNYIVVWDSTELDFKATNGKEHYKQNFEYLGCCEEIIIIGNIFDNPELLQNNQ